jgi:phosphoketolase
MSSTTAVLDAEKLKRMDAYWRAANYLSIVLLAVWLAG